MKRNLSSFTLAGVSVVCILILAACNCAPSLRYITVSPASATISAGTTQQFAATLYYSDGTVKDGTGVAQWSSSNMSVATVAAGLATAVGGGTTTISATMAGVSPATATLTVNSFTSITVSPSDPSIAAGQTQQFTATGMPGSVDVTSQVTWASDTTSVATITSGGLATGVATGTSSVSATLSGVTGSTTLTVTPAVPVSLVVTPSSKTIAVSNAVTYTVEELYSDGTLHAPASPGSIVWTSSATTTATIVSAPASGANGIAVGLKAGTSNITATEGSLTTTTAAVLTVVAGTTHFAYVGNNGNGVSGADDIEWYSVDATSATPFTFVNSLAGGAPTQIALHPSGAYLYWTKPDSTVNVYDVHADGSLTATGLGPYLAGSGNFNFMAVDPLGRFLYVTDASTTTIFGFTISLTDGSLTLISSAPFNFASLSTPEDIVIDPTGNYLYVTNFGNDTVSGFSINQTTGVLTALSPATAATGGEPQFAAMDPSGTHLYVGNNDNTVTMIPIGAGGAMGTPVTISAIATATDVTNVAVDPSGTHLYVLDSGSTNGQVFGFNLNSDGTVGSAISGTPQPAGGFPFYNMAIDPTGKLLATANNFDNDISLYAIGSGGALTPTTPATVATAGQAPNFVVYLNAP